MTDGLGGKMPLFHCDNCHHEWERAEEDTTCDWCDSENAYILEEKTPLERTINDIYRLVEENDE